MGDEVEMLFLHGRYLEPTLSWLQLEHIDPEGSFTEVAVSDELEEALNEAIVAGTVTPMEFRDTSASVTEGQRACER